MLQAYSASIFYSRWNFDRQLSSSRRGNRYYGAGKSLIERDCDIYRFVFELHDVSTFPETARPTYEHAVDLLVARSCHEGLELRPTLAAARHGDVAVFLDQVEAGARGIYARAVILHFALWDIKLQGFRRLVCGLLMGQRSRERGVCAGF